MCGIAGLIGRDGQWDEQTLQRAAIAMADAIAHRGPDDDGVWLDESAGIALSFRRLAIQDLSQNGHQPMLSVDEGLVLTFNGEIYNAPALRGLLEPARGLPWRGHSDTEILLEALRQWGLARTLDAIDGMFSFALWDRKEKRLTLARDRFGEKPLYFGRWGDAFAWGSELPALRALPGPAPQTDAAAIALFLAHRYVPAPFSIYQGVYKLPAGHYISMHLPFGKDAVAAPKDMRCYWRADHAAAQAAATPFSGNQDDAAAMLDDLLRDVVTERLLSDVPLGCFLSGGIDSSLVTAIASHISPAPSTFTIGFDDAKLDEAPFAEAVAQHLGTRQVTTRQRGTDALALVQESPHFYAEPFADPSALPMLLLCRHARQSVTVALTGDGGDELFLGYGRYGDGARAITASQARPPLQRRTMGLAAILMAPIAPRRARRLRNALVDQPGDWMAERSTAWRSGPPIAGAAPAPWNGDALYGTAIPTGFADPAMALSLIDCAHALPDGLQVKADRASMAFGLELRAPLLSRRIAEFAWSLPVDLKLAANGKRVMKDCLARHVPRELFERPKAGFEPPLANWLRGALRPWADELLNDTGLQQSLGLLPAPLASAWASHISGKNLSGDLWPVLMLLAWARQQ